MPSCSVLQCKNNSRRKNVKNAGISYHRFPNDPDIKEKWIDSTGRENWMPTRLSTICSQHFSENDIILSPTGLRYIKPSAVPTIKIMMLYNLESDNESSVLDEDSLDPFQPVVSKKTIDKAQRELGDDGANIIHKTPDDSCKDEYGVFAELVALKLRKLSTHNRLLAQERITDILLSLEAEELNEGKPNEEDHTVCPINVVNVKSEDPGSPLQDWQIVSSSYESS